MSGQLHNCDNTSNFHGATGIMAYQYAHHRPMTPITPIHSPHPSGGSSIRAKTPGQLSLHEYRKMQVTPSPPAIPGQKTVKKKRGLSSLGRSVGTPAMSPESDFFASFQSLTTPPETPSVGLPMDFTSNVLPVDATKGSRVVHASVDSTYPEFVHLLGVGSQNSPPYSPPTPLLSSSASRHSVLQRFVGAPRNLSRPWTDYWSKDQRYVLHSEVARPKSEQTAKRAQQAAAVAETPGVPVLHARHWASRFEEAPEQPSRSAPPGSASQRHSSVPQRHSVERLLSRSHVALSTSEDNGKSVRWSQHRLETERPRER